MDTIHGSRISESPEWEKAFTDEIRSHPEILSKMSTQNPKEAFAEISSLLFAPEAWVANGVLDSASSPHEEANLFFETNFPDCYKIWKKQGLIR